MPNIISVSTYAGTLTLCICQFSEKNNCTVLCKYVIEDMQSSSNHGTNIMKLWFHHWTMLNYKFDYLKMAHGILVWGKIIWLTNISPFFINALKPRQNDFYFAEKTFDSILFKENYSFFYIKIWNIYLWCQHWFRKCLGAEYWHIHLCVTWPW